MSATFRDRFDAFRRFLNTPGFGRRVVVLLVVALALKLAVNVTAFVIIDRTAEQDALARSFQEIRRASRSVLIGVLTAETAQRGYLLTGEAAREAETLEGLRQVDRALLVLGEEASRDPDLAPLVSDVREAARAKAQELGVTLDLARGGRVPDAVRVMATGEGQALTDRLRTGVGAIDELVGSRLQAANAASTNGLRTVGVVNGISSVLIISLAVAIFWLLRTYISEMQAKQLELDRLNAGLEDEVRDRTLALTRANEEIQRFAYIVSHDLRAPLVNVMGYTSELQASGKALETQLAAVEAKAPKLVQPEAVAAIREDVPEAIGFIRASTEKMDRLINAILRLSRDGRRALHPERIDLAALATNAAKAVHHQTDQQGAQIVVGSLPTIESDRLTVEQLLGNLVDNAVKYLDPARPGRIRIDGLERADGMVEVRVADNGRGVAQRDLERIFELFRRAGKQDRPGEGLGLAFVRNGARRLGGDVRVESVAGEGSTFSLILPRRLVVTASGEPA
ncbi:MAG TPA: ATP-binding protein [Brevundimonas sp.]|jgi:signal transduction histidine kinase|uniref:sensor histidine kinase n=1 Tax=Brevundimonas sp. TaxID=1871086 RepID=UPI002DF2E062|nr:ATP-binding protein [Brevundimonas sp.]